MACASYCFIGYSSYSRLFKKSRMGVKGRGFHSDMSEKRTGTDGWLLIPSPLIRRICCTTDFYVAGVTPIELMLLNSPMSLFQKTRVYIQRSQAQHTSCSCVVNIFHCPTLGMSCLWPSFRVIVRSRPSARRFTSYRLSTGLSRLLFRYLHTCSSFRSREILILCCRISFSTLVILAMSSWEVSSMFSFSISMWRGSTWGMTDRRSL